MKCGDKIRYYRELIGMSQDELARKVGYAGRSAVSRIESGKRDLTQSKVVQFAQALGVDPVELVDDREPTATPPAITEKQRLIEKVDRINDDQVDMYMKLMDMPTDKIKAILDLLN